MPGVSGRVKIADLVRVIVWPHIKLPLPPSEVTPTTKYDHQAADGRGRMKVPVYGWLSNARLQVVVIIVMVEDWSDLPTASMYNWSDLGGKHLGQTFQ